MLWLPSGTNVYTLKQDQIHDCLNKNEVWYNSDYSEFLFEPDSVHVYVSTVESVQVALQWGNVQLRVTIQVMLQQSLVNKRVLHLQKCKHDSGTPQRSCMRYGEEEFDPLDRRTSYVCLYKLAALVSNPGHTAEDVHSAFGMHHVHQGIDHNEGPGPSDSSTRD